VADTPARGAPNPDRPRLPDADEAKLVSLDKRGARAYTAIEDGLEAIKALFAVGTGIVVAGNFSDTAVTRISEAAAKKLQG
jgi:hypothetical protein